MDYQTFMRHAKKVTSNAKEDRPVLGGVNHLEGGSAVVTDSFRLYDIKNIHDRKETVLISPEGKKIEGKYPETDRLIPDSLNAKQSFDISVEEFLTAFDIMQTAAKTVGAEKPVARIRGNEVHFCSFEVDASYRFSVEFEETFASNPVFWVDALRLFKAFKYETITFNFYGSMRPFTLVSKGDRLTVLILPIRVY